MKSERRRLVEVPLVLVLTSQNITDLLKDKNEVIEWIKTDYAQTGEGFHKAHLEVMKQIFASLEEISVKEMGQ